MENIFEINDTNMIAMKLLHYFITERNYTPIILNGVEDEIWLENLDEDCEIVRIVLHHIHNDEQYKFDVFKTNRIVKKIKAKTFSFKLNTLSIFLNLGSSVDLSKELPKNGVATCVTDEKDVKKDKLLLETYPDIYKNISRNKEKGADLFIKITDEINEHNHKDQKQMDKVFRPKKPIITYLLVLINVLLFVAPALLGQTDNIFRELAVFGPYIRQGEYYRLITGTFIHANIAHLIFNMYALWIIGIQLESFLGKWKYLLIYLFSGLTASLMSITFHNTTVSVGASGAIFGLLGAMLYFGYHYRVYLGTVIKSQIVPLIVLNLALGFLVPGIDNAAHIGGLIGGVLMMMATGVDYKSATFEKVNGVIVSILYLAFLIYMGIFYIH